MQNNLPIHEWVELYNLDLLEGEEKLAFEAELASNPALAKLLSEHRAFLRLVNHKTSKTLVQNQLQLIKKENTHNIRRIADGMQVHVNKYWKTASVAAGVALLASLLTFQMAKNSVTKELYASVEKLNRIENEQKKIKREVKSLGTQINTPQTEQPTGNAKKAGTCFVIDNSGYVLTNAHVVEGNVNLYVFTNDNIGHKATIVKQDAESDLALLKIDEKEFSFGKNALPYGFATKEFGLSEKVFTIGYPKSSVVYNEGYLSSQNGKNDDSSMYQLELPVAPGVSGSPVFDVNGNVLAIINSKESIGSNATYALKASQMKSFLKGIDSVHTDLKWNATAQPRSKQVATAKEFVLVVKAY
jgi:serine protease Do